MISQTRIFPLRLVDFEHYMLKDDHDLFPMTIPSLLRFAGTVDTTKLESAFEKTILSQPLTRAKVQKQGNEYCWIDAEIPKIQWVEFLPEFERLDIRREAGIKVYAAQKQGGLEVKLFIHHCVADGAGITQLLEQWLGYYAESPATSGHVQSEFEGESADLTTTGVEDDQASMKNRIAVIDPQTLVSRGRLGMNFWKYCLRPFQEFCGFIGVLEFFSHRPVAIGPQSYSEEFPSDVDPEIRFQAETFTPEESKQVLAAAKAAKCTVNDCLLAAVYSGCQKWLDEKLPSESDRHLRIMIPMDMRGKKQATLPITNFVTMVFLDRRPKRSKSFENIRWYVWLEMSAIKRLRSGLTFIHLIKLLRWLGKLPRLLRTDRCVATTIASNMGPLFRNSPLRNKSGKIVAGDLVLESIAMFPPVRPFTWITFAVTTYAGQIQFNTSYASAALNPEDAAFILQEIKRDFMGDSSGTP